MDGLLYTVIKPFFDIFRKVRNFTKEIHEQRTPSGVLLCYFVRESDPLHRPTLVVHRRVDIQPQRGTHVVKQSHVHLSGIVVNELLYLHTAKNAVI